MKTLALFLIAIFTLNDSGLASQTNPLPAVSQMQADGTTQATKTKAEVQMRGTGERSRVRVKLRDGTDLKGYVSKIEENSFEVTDRKTGKVTSIRYDDANEVQRQGMSRTTKILIVIGIVAAWIGIATALACSSEGGPHC